MDTKHVGSCSELKAAVWLMEQGYEVARNLSAHGIWDLVAVRDVEVLLFDVKTSTGEGRGGCLTPEQRAAGVKIMRVSPDRIWISGTRANRNIRPVFCINCGAQLETTSNTKKRCRSCADEHIREYGRAWKRNRRDTSDPNRKALRRPDYPMHREPTNNCGGHASFP